MRWFWILLVKFALIGVVLSLVLPAWNVRGFASIWWGALWLTLAIFVLGDLVVLPWAGNVWATAIDAVLAAVVVWAVWGTRLPGAGILTAGVAVGVVEWFLHRWIRPLVTARRRPVDNS